MLIPSMRASTAAGTIQRLQREIPAATSLSIVSERPLDPLTLSAEQQQAMVAANQTLGALHHSKSHGTFITPALNDGSQIFVDFSDARLVTISLMKAGKASELATIPRSKLAWEDISALPEHIRLINEWKAWADEPGSSRQNRAKALACMVECLFSGGKELRMRGMKLTSLPANLPLGLTLLDVSNNNLSVLPELPETLSSLLVGANQLTSLPPLPVDLTELDAGHNQIRALTFLPVGLTSLKVNNNNIVMVDKVPVGLVKLDVSHNQLAVMPTLPHHLKELYADNNKLVRLTDLPADLLVLNVSNNQLTWVSELPGSLIEFKCNNNKLRELREIPYGLKELHLENNHLAILPPLPMTLTSLNASRNKLQMLPALPAGLISMAVASNLLRVLPALPDAMAHLIANHNPLSRLPKLPDTLQLLDVNYCDLTELPVLPPGLKRLDVANNRLVMLPGLPDHLKTLFVGNNSLRVMLRLPAELNELSISTNQVRYLPESHFRLPISFDDNPEKWPPFSMITRWFAPQARPDIIRQWKPLLQETNGAAFVLLLTRLHEDIPPVLDAGVGVHISEWLNELTTSRGLRINSFNMALEASSFCNERVTLGWNAMQPLRLFRQAALSPEGLKPQKFLILARQIFAIERIEALVADVTRGMSEGTNSMAIYMSYLWKLKDRLALPDILAKKMPPTDTIPVSAGEMAFVENAVLTAEEKDFPRWFLDWKYCQEYLQQHMTLQESQALQSRQIAVYKTQLEQLQKNHKPVPGEEGVIKRLELQANSRTNEIIFGPLARAQIYALGRAAPERVMPGRAAFQSMPTTEIGRIAVSGVIRRVGG